MRRPVHGFLLAAGTLLLLLLAGVGSLVWLLQRPVHVADDFEERELSSVWVSARMVPGSFATQSEVVHSGRRAAQITLHAGDRFEPATDEGPANERDELMEAPSTWSRMGRAYEYAFSLYLPPDFPIVDTRLVVAQWKQLCEWIRCRPGNPVVAIRYVGGVLYVTRKNEDGQVTLYRSRGEMRGRWLDFRFVIRFSQHEDGRIDGWMNGERIALYRGVTAYRSALGYPAHGFFYFKTGLYRDLMKEPMTLYLDGFRKDQVGP
jgi:hypothetical protein